MRELLITITENESSGENININTELEFSANIRRRYEDMKNNCKRFEENLGSIYEDMKCMLCDKQSQCDIKYREALLEKRNNEACRPCTKCRELLQCKKYKYGKRCIGQYELSHEYNECARCNCRFNCIQWSGEQVSFKCIKDLIAVRDGQEYRFFKNKDYTFIKICNTLIYEYTIITINQNNLKEYLIPISQDLI